jgi:hypothetical protein
MSQVYERVNRGNSPAVTVEDALMREPATAA